MEQLIGQHEISHCLFVDFTAEVLVVPSRETPVSVSIELIVSKLEGCTYVPIPWCWYSMLVTPSKRKPSK